MCIRDRFRFSDVSNGFDTRLCVSLSLVPAQEQSERTKAIANCDAADARKNFLIIFNVLRLIKIIYVNRPPPINNNFHLSRLLIISELI